MASETPAETDAERHEAVIEAFKSDPRCVEIREAGGSVLTRHAATIAALEASPWCRTVGPPRATTAIFLSSPEALAALKKALGR
jgi:hypothetical protein